ncbi:MAG: hypothetical protein CM1200mP28_17640 [Deltaproteobacteria bacterium]|nr:MAG: hypothetical protein CM1200mP28_17640 [Deltaproteobacteria bacterium]
MIQSLQYGADLVLAEKNYDQAFALSLQYSKMFGGMNRNTAYNPMTIEGKKTVSIEIFNQLGRVPDHVFVSVGDGVILSGLYKGFRDLLQLKQIPRMPEIMQFRHPEVLPFSGQCLLENFRNSLQKLSQIQFP